MTNVQEFEGKPCIITLPEQLIATIAAIDGQIAGLSALASGGEPIQREIESLKAARAMIREIINANNFVGPILVGYPRAG